MKKMFYSEVLDKYFDDEKECRRAETEAAVEKAKKEKIEREIKAKEEAKKAEISREKKALAKAVEDAETELTEAYSKFDIIKKEAAKELQEAYKKYNTSINNARNVIKDAENKKYDAVAEFNNKFGVYTTSYSGEKALKEFQRINTWMSNIFNGFFF